MCRLVDWGRRRARQLRVDGRERPVEAALHSEQRPAHHVHEYDRISVIVTSLKNAKDKKKELLKKTGKKVEKTKKPEPTAIDILDRAEKFLSKDDHVQALAAAEPVLGDDTQLARAALVRGSDNISKVIR